MSHSGSIRKLVPDFFQHFCRDAAEKFALARGRHHGACMEFVNYKILENKDPIPEGYQLLVEGSKLAVPVSWLHSVLSQCVGRGSSFILTMLANGLLRPWEVVHGGTSAYTGTYLEHVVNALKRNVTQQQALPLPPGTRPACGYVHPDDAKKWMAALTGLGGGRGYSKSVAKEDIERLLREKHTLKEVAHLLNISRPTLYKMLRKYRLDSAFKFMTNEQIMHLMRGIVTEFPQAAVDVEVMLEKLNQRSIFSINPKRVLACLKKLNSD